MTARRGVTVTGPSDGRAVVFLHGAAINRHMWVPHVRLLGDDIRSVTVDLPGHGDLSDQSYDTEASVDVTVDAIQRHVSGSAVLVGLSLGGYIALATAARRPDLVSGLVLSGATIRYTRWASITTKIGKWSLPITARKAIKGFDEQLRKAIGEEDAEVVLAGGISVRGALDALGSLPGVDYARRAAEAGFDGPVIIANGERDTKNIADEEKFRQWFPDAISQPILDGGHAAALKHPERVVEIVHTALGKVARRHR